MYVCVHIVTVEISRFKCSKSYFVCIPILQLESEVETLRLRLDSLRKAKNTTIVKREREPALIPISPKLGQRGLLAGWGAEGRGREG